MSFSDATVFCLVTPLASKGVAPSGAGGSVLISIAPNPYLSLLPYSFCTQHEYVFLHQPIVKPDLFAYITNDA
jgi:hypothetical protein